jgi:hypothetical protein
VSACGSSSGGEPAVCRPRRQRHCRPRTAAYAYKTKGVARMQLLQACLGSAAMPGSVAGCSAASPQCCIFRVMFQVVLSVAGCRSLHNVFVNGLAACSSNVVLVNCTSTQNPTVKRRRIICPRKWTTHLASMLPVAVPMLEDSTMLELGAHRQPYGMLVTCYDALTHLIFLRSPLRVGWPGLPSSRGKRPLFPSWSSGCMKR